jgi:hypothetical protein
MLESSKFFSPRRGLAGLWDRLIGPGATTAESILIVTSSIVGAFASASWLWWLGFDTFHLVIGSVLGFDIIGGAVCNTTDTTKRWYHRPKVTRLQHITFILPHLIHVAIVSWFFRESTQFDWIYFSSISAYLIFATVIILAVTNYLKRPVATGLYLIGIAIGFYRFGLTIGLEWFIPALFLKLLTGHLVPDQSHHQLSS